MTTNAITIATLEAIRERAAGSLRDSPKDHIAALQLIAAMSEKEIHRLEELSDNEGDPEACDECEAIYPANARSIAGNWHTLACSLHSLNFGTTESR